jgi:hypothetical protein
LRGPTKNGMSLARPRLVDWRWSDEYAIWEMSSIVGFWIRSSKQEDE